ncbi:MAG: hypothetical protein ACQJCO_03790 [cyanobacterium endosymbiont of Rhopalodia sterrenbergii]
MRRFYERYVINLPLEDFVGENESSVFELFREFLLPNYNKQMRSIVSHLSA